MSKRADSRSTIRPPISGLGAGIARRAGNSGVLLALSALLLACPGTQSPAAGCSKDTDCKGDRVCDSGKCVWPDKPAEERVAEPVVTAPERGGPAWFRGGPGHAGPTEAAGPVETPKLAWEVDLGAVVFATPVVTAGPGDVPAAFVGTHAGRFVGVGLEGDQAGKLVVDMTLGGRIWGTAAVDEQGILYVGGDDDTLYAIDPVKQEIVWKKQLGECEPTRAPGPEGARCDVDGGPTIGPDGDLYVGADGLYRIGRDGEIKWHFTAGEERPKHVFSSPVVTAEGQVYYGGQDGFVTALAADGTERWRYKITADVDGSAALGPDGELFVGADDGRVHALRSDGSLRWSFVAQKDIRSAIGTAADGRLYVSSFDGNLYALTPGGEVVWVFASGGVINSSPVVDAAGTVYVGSQDDHLYAIEPDGKLRYKLEFPKDVDGSVAITENGTIIVGCDDGHLRAYR